VEPGTGGAQQSARVRTVVARAVELCREWGLAELPADLQRNSLDYYYLSVWPGLRHLRPATELTLPQRPSSVSYAYVHIPFCSGICDFCSYFLTTTRDAGTDARVERYLDQLLDQVRIHQRDQEIALTSIYLGGGTPSILTPDQLERLLGTLRELGVLTPGLVGTMELHPEVFGELASRTTKHRTERRLDRTLDVLARHGIRRVSIGYQSDDDALLDASNRRHQAEFLTDAAKHLRERGFTFNLDLMYGLPGQSVEAWVGALEAALTVRPDSVATYCTFVDPGTPLWRRASKEPTLLATPQTIQLCHIAAQLVLAEAGYHELPNDFYAVPTEDPAGFTQLALPSQGGSLALGAGAYGYYPGVQYFNEMSFGGYARAIAEGRVPVWRAAVLDPAEELARDIMFSFKNSPVLALPLFRDRHGTDPVTAYPGEFEELARLRLVEIEADRVRLTPKGRLVVEEIACRFAPHRPEGTVASRVEGNLIRKHHFAPTYSR
jgi:oxygen-independent coproporphyrinogen III oxidase